MGFLENFKTKADRYMVRKKIEFEGAKKLHELEDDKKANTKVENDTSSEPEKTNTETEESAESKDVENETESEATQSEELDTKTKEEILKNIKKYDEKIIAKFDKNIQKISDLCYDISANILPVIEKSDLMDYLLINKADESEIILGVLDEIMSVCEDEEE